MDETRELPFSVEGTSKYFASRHYLPSFRTRDAMKQLLTYLVASIVFFELATDLFGLTLAHHVIETISC
jgi:hypothetical protein